MPLRLSDSEVRHFREKGYLPAVKALEPTEARDLRHWVEQFEIDHPDDRWAFNLKANLLFESVDRLCRDPRLLDPVEDLIGSDILLSTATFRIKEADGRGYYGWHQDDRFIQVDPHWVLVFLAVTDCTVDNGCLRVLPGTHTGPLLRAEIDPADTHNALTRQPTIVDVDESMAIPLVLKAGEIGFFHSHIVHGSGPNQSDDRRIGLIIDYMPAAGRQSKGRGSATLVRGENRQGYFAPEPPPHGEFSGANILARRRVLNEYPENVYFGVSTGNPPVFPDRAE